jgi:superkiller protein 3
MFAEAMQELKKALELDPGLISAYINLGSVFGDKGSYPQAIKYFEKAIQLDRGSLNAYNGLGVTYARMKKYDLARKAWEKALEIGPDNKAVQENLRKLRELGI